MTKEDIIRVEKTLDYQYEIIKNESYDSEWIKIFEQCYNDIVTYVAKWHNIKIENGKHTIF